MTTWAYRGAVFSGVGSYKEAFDCYDRALMIKSDNMLVIRVREEVRKKV
jgi:hypothetical protein